MSEKKRSDIDDIIESIKAAVEEGNANKVIITNKEGNEVASFPVNAGIVGGVIGLAAAPWAVIAAAIGGLTFGFKISVEKKDGDIIDVYEDENDNDW